MENINQDILKLLQDIILNNNQYVNIFKTAAQTMQNAPELCLILKAIPNTWTRHNVRNYDFPSANEIAAILHHDSEEYIPYRDIMIKRCDNSYHRINETHCLYDTLRYVLMHIRGEKGSWTETNTFSKYDKSKRVL